MCVYKIGMQYYVIYAQFGENVNVVFIICTK